MLSPILPPSHFSLSHKSTHGLHLLPTSPLSFLPLLLNCHPSGFYIFAAIEMYNISIGSFQPLFQVSSLEFLCHILNCWKPHPSPLLGFFPFSLLCLSQSPCWVSMFSLRCCPCRTLPEYSSAYAMLWRYVLIVSDPDKIFKNMDLGQCPGKTLHFPLLLFSLAFLG